MKLQHLAIGARFEYEGVAYVKTGPLTASSEEGGQRIIPRHATLRPLDGTQVATPGTPADKGLDRARLDLAFEAFCATCRQLVDMERQADLEAARKRFLAALK